MKHLSDFKFSFDVVARLGTELLRNQKQRKMNEDIGKKSEELGLYTMRIRWIMNYYLYKANE